MSRQRRHTPRRTAAQLRLGLPAQGAAISAFTARNTNSGVFTSANCVKTVADASLSAPN
jgi:hypothetical protein